MPNSENPFAALSRVMHEPNRLALVSALAAAVDGMTFTALKEACNLTDGNLNRHLKALEDDGVISQNKDVLPGGGRPRTTVILTPLGRRRFVKYLETLEEVLKHAAAAASTEVSAATSHEPATVSPLPAMAQRAGHI